jgi:ABC-type multidrug transport system ATPase subunit
VFGTDSFKLGRQRVRLGVVFQNPSLDPILTVRENLAAHAAILGAPRGAVERSAELVGVTDRLDDRVGTLSGGLARRTDLARAILHEPELIILDEPTTGLDHDARASFLDALERLRGERTLTLILSTHLMDEAERADEVVLMCRGRVVASGPPDDLRRELGRHLIRASDTPSVRSVVAGLEIKPRGRQIVVSGDESGVAEAARALVAADLSFEFGPPTLGDVYLHATGHDLAGEVGA